MAQAVDGDDIRVDAGAIEKQLAELWRAEKQEKDGAVTRAALWNVVAHSWTGDQHAHATETLAAASASVPQRTIVVRSEPHGRSAISSWISANCHMIGGGRQVCSEEVSIVAAGDRVHHIAPLMKALLLPDMPVAVWWLGDLPDDHRYVETLLDPADRLIVDSSHFDSPSDLELVLSIAERTTTAPADLNWARLEEWRVATATLFDPPAMRDRLRAIRAIRVTSAGGGFGATASALLYSAWIASQGGSQPELDVKAAGEGSGIRTIELHFDDASTATIRPRPLVQAPDDLIVRLLKRPEADKVYLRALRAALAPG